MTTNKILDNPIVWIDLETTGLHVDRDCILEVACVVTDGKLENVIQGPNIVIKRDKSIIENMNFWCKNQHAKSGLSGMVLSSSAIPIKDAERQLMDFVKQYVPVSNIAPLGGSSVHFDKEFLRKEMPDFYNHLHFRIIDVSSIGELVYRWNPTILRRRPKKCGNHRALDDINDSIRELQFYKNNVFKFRI